MEKVQEAPHWRTLVQLGFIASAGFSMILILPVALGGMVDLMGFSNQTIGWIAAANALGIALGALYVPLSGARFRLMPSIRLSLLGLIIIDFSCAFLESSASLMAFRLFSGMLGGVLYAGILRVLAGLPKQERGFGIYVITYCSWSAILFFLSPYLLAWGGVKALFYMITGSGIIAYLISPVLRPFHTKTITVEADTLSYLLRQRPVLTSLISYLLLMAASGAFYAYVERIGNANGLSASFIGMALSNSNFAGILAGILVYRLGNKFGLTLPIMGGIGLLTVCFLIINWIPTRIIYFLSVFGVSGCWGFLIAYFQKVQSVVDLDGKIVALGATINLGGRAIGPALVSFFIVGNNFDAVIIFSVVSVALCVILLLPALLKIDQQQLELGRT